MPAQDKRIKLCSNEACEMHQKKVRQKAEMYYCPKCGRPLRFVCKECFREIEDLGPDHAVCALCSANHEQQRNNRIDAVRKIGGAAAGAVMSAAAAIAAKALPQIEDKVIRKGTRVVVDVAKRVLKL